jgi:tetratricopeptide (TPR) repeat protein
MDSLITAAARALAAGDPLGALKRVALRDDAPALALRGIAMAQLGDFPRAKSLLRRAARAFGPGERVARARCVVAEAEIALAARDLTWPADALDAARTTLEQYGDRVNAAHARYLAVRRFLLIGRLSEAERMLAHLDAAALPPALRTAHELVVAGIAIRRTRARAARAALARAQRAALEAGVPALSAEVASVARLLGGSAARRVGGDERMLLLDDVEELLASGALVVDSRRHAVSRRDVVVSLAGRPVLFALVRGLGEAWPADASRASLLRAAGAHFTDASHRQRLRVEIARLRRLLQPLAGVAATKAGFTLVPRGTGEVVVIAPPVHERHGAVLALLSDGEGWSSSALALALGTSQRTVQRALDSLAAAGTVQPAGRGRARRWMAAPAPGFATALLLPAALPIE